MARTVLERISKHLGFQLTQSVVDEGRPECWIWKGASNLKQRTNIVRVRFRGKTIESRNPVPVMKMAKRFVNPARILYELKTGVTLTRTHQLLSQCGDTLCINPLHRAHKGYSAQDFDELIQLMEMENLWHLTPVELYDQMDRDFPLELCRKALQA